MSVMASIAGEKTTIEYNDKVVRQFMTASLFWGIVGMLVGVLIALQLRLGNEEVKARHPRRHH